MDITILLLIIVLFLNATGSITIHRLLYYRSRRPYYKVPYRGCFRFPGTVHTNHYCVAANRIQYYNIYCLFIYVFIDMELNEYSIL